MSGSTSAPGRKPSPDHPGSADPWGKFFAHFPPVRTAVLVDAAFFLRRSRRIRGRLDPDEAARRLHHMALAHLEEDRRRVARLYRIFVYDAPPARWKGHTPIERKAVDLAKTEQARWRTAFHEQLRGMRKVALRLGHVAGTQVSWRLKPEGLADLCRGRRDWASVNDGDFELDLRQKGVDMRLGLDVASLAYKRQVEQIVLVTGDSDFVPAAKLARREGIDVVLDPMWQDIRADLSEHIDGLRSTCPRPGPGRGSDRTP
jgi:uncharacterized LabA/DUF88 family protein